MSPQTVLTLVFLAALFFLAVNYQLTHYFARKNLSTPIQKHSFHVHSTREAFPGAKDRVYVILGGAGFTGSWMARYLLLRGEKKVVVLDKVPVPHDVLKHGATFYQIDLTHILAVDQMFRDIAEQFCTDSTRVIFYNCSCARRYDEPRISALVDPGLRIVEVIAGNFKHFVERNVVLIHIGDSMSNRHPVQWWKFWDTRRWIQHSRSDTAPIRRWGLEQKSVAFSVYAFFQGTIETSIRILPAVTTGAVRSEGFVSGHIGDHFLTPSISYGGGILHSTGVPMSIIHVEDLVRGALALEYMLLDPETSPQYRGAVFTIQGEGETTLDEVYKYIKHRRPSFKAINVAPGAAYLVGWIFSIMSLFLKPLSPDAPDEVTSILSGGPKTLTLARFSTLQIGQAHNKQNTHRTHEMLGYRPNFTVSQTIDSVIDEIEAFEKHKKKKDMPTNDDLRTVRKT